MTQHPTEVKQYYLLVFQQSNFRWVLGRWAVGLLEDWSSASLPLGVGCCNWVVESLEDYSIASLPLGVGSLYCLIVGRLYNCFTSVRCWAVGLLVCFDYRQLACFTNGLLVWSNWLRKQFSQCIFSLKNRVAVLKSVFVSRTQIRLVLQWIINNIMSPKNNTEETRLYVKILTPVSFRN